MHLSKAEMEEFLHLFRRYLKPSFDGDTEVSSLYVCLVLMSSFFSGGPHDVSWDAFLSLFRLTSNTGHTFN